MACDAKQKTDPVENIELVLQQRDGKDARKK